MASQERITVHNLADLKNTSDDAIPNYLNSLGFRQDHRLADTRLALGYGAFALAAACFLWDRQLGFERTKHATAAAVLVYALLNGVLSYWIAFVERGVVYAGHGPDGSKISVATSTKKNVPTYYLKITVSSPGQKSETQTIELARSFTAWFDVDGRFVAAPFQTVLATAVPVIGRADPKRAGAGTGTETQTQNQNDLLSADAATLDALLASSSEATGADAAAAGSSKKSKQRRKA